MRSASSSTTTSTSATDSSFGLQQVDQPQRRGDDDVDAVLQRVDLLGATGAAVHGQDAPAGVLGDRAEHLGDLDRQLPGRYEHQSQRSSGLGPLDDAREHRNTEGERLAGPGAGSPAHVAPVHRHGDGGGLDLERLGEPGGGQTVVDPRRHAELGEAGGCLDGRQDGDRRQRGRSGRPPRRGRTPMTAAAARAPRRGEAAVMVAMRLP